MASLFKVGSGKTPLRVIQFDDLKGERKTIRLGRVKHEDAKEFMSRFESLLSAAVMNVTPKPEVSEWVAGLSDDMHAKLAKYELVSPRIPAESKPTAPIAGDWCDQYIKSRKDLKPSSIKKLERTAAMVKDFFADRHIDEITVGDASEWRHWLVAKKLSEGTVRLHARNAKLMFNGAVDKELIEKSPFRKLVSRSIAAERERYVTAQEAEAIIEKCPNVQWKALFGLSRLAGLRTPSETHGLEWGDIDFERGRMIVKSPKTERWEGKETRIVPIEPRLQTILQEAFAEAEPGQTKVITLGLNNLRRNFRVIVRRAGLIPWEDTFQTLRRSRETEWSEKYPGHVVAAWVGHSEDVSRRHYLMVLDSHFDTAAGIAQPESDSAAKSAAETPGEVAQGDEVAVGAEAHTGDENADFACADAENGDGPRGIRTPDQAIMSRLL